jgi:phosphatidylinositol alpha-mannosyltransferase
LKIALVSPYDWAAFGGVNSHLSQLSGQFLDAGHEVRILAPASKDIDDPLVTTIGRPFPVPAGGSSARIALSPRLGREVRAYLEEQQFDIVHVHEPLMPSLPIQVLRLSRAANPSVVNVGTFHARKEGGNRLYSYGRRLLKRWFRELDGKIAVSSPAAQYVSRYFNGFYNIIPNGIDVGRFDDASLAPIEEFDEGKINILYVGRAEKRKGLGYLIRAFGMVNARNPDTRLLVVGPDSRAKRNYAESVATNRQRGIVFVPGPSDEDLPRYHRTAHIFCSPATGNESQGIVLLEAMSANLPVVASNIEGYASVITHGEDGLLVRPKDPMALADALSALVDDERLRRKLAKAGRRRVEDYSWPRVTQQVLSYYERLLDTNETVEKSRRRGRGALTAAS